MAIEVFNRQEKKYLLSEDAYQILLQKIQEHMDPDAYNRDGACYSICNLYYDTLDDRLIRSSIEKPVYKEKLRLRSYGTPNATDQVFIEIKKKYKNVVNKRRTGLQLIAANDYLEHNIMPDEESPGLNHQVMREIDYFKKFYQIVPKVYLSYNRKAYFEKNNGDFRITFDQDITTRRYDLDLALGSYGDKLLPDHVYLMEIKINRAVPLWFTKILSELQIYPVSFSKYGMEYKNYVMKQNETMKGMNLCLNQYLATRQQKTPSKLALQ